MEAKFVSNLLHFTHRSNETPYYNSTQDYRGFLVPHLSSGGGGWSLPYCFNMAVCGVCFWNSCPILDYKYAISPLTLFQKSDEKCSKIVPALPSHIPKWLKGDPPCSYGPSFRGFLHNLAGTGRRDPWERGCFLQVFWLPRGTVKQFHNTVLGKATSKPVCYSFLWKTL